MNRNFIILAAVRVAIAATLAHCGTACSPERADALERPTIRAMETPVTVRDRCVGADTLKAKVETLVAGGDLDEAARQIDRFQSRSDCSIEGADVVLRDAWRAAIHGRVGSSSREAVDPGLDLAAVYMKRYPGDEVVGRDQRLLRARHEDNRERFVMMLEQLPGVSAELNPVGGRRYDVELVWIAPFEEPAQLQIATLALIGGVGRATRDSGFRSRNVDLDVPSMNTRIRFPTSCARKLLRDAERNRSERTMLRTLQRCVKVL